MIKWIFDYYAKRKAIHILDIQEKERRRGEEYLSIVNGNIGHREILLSGNKETLSDWFKIIRSLHEEEKKSDLSQGDPGEELEAFKIEKHLRQEKIVLLNKNIINMNNKIIEDEKWLIDFRKRASEKGL